MKLISLVIAKASATLAVAVFTLSFLLVSPTSFAEDAENAIEFKDDVQKSTYNELVNELRCPKCQNQNIADSNAVIARDMRVKTKSLLDEGYKKQEVIDYMVDRYGQFAHYQPPMTIATSLLWFVPIAFVLFAVILLIRRSQNGNIQHGEGISRTENIDEAYKESESSIDAELEQLLDTADSNKKDSEV